MISGELHDTDDDNDKDEQHHEAWQLGPAGRAPNTARHCRSSHLEQQSPRHGRNPMAAATSGDPAPALLSITSLCSTLPKLLLGVRGHVW